MSERLLIQFDQALLQAGTRFQGLWLHGGEHGTDGRQAQVFFSGARPVALPAQWHAVQVCERIDGQGRRSWQIRGPEGSADIAARAVQVHRDVAGVFYAALPSQAPPRLVRLGWTVLLALLRIPGVASLIAKLRSH